MCDLALKTLIVNADDYGLSPEVSAGIRIAHASGIVTSTSVLANASSLVDEIRALREECVGIGIGVHLNLTEGSPLHPPHKLRSLVDSDGEFGLDLLQPGRISAVVATEVKSEWRAQVERVLRTGIEPDHLDSHHHISYRAPRFLDITLELAAEFGMHVRTAPSPEAIATEARTVESMKRQLDTSGVHHPDRLIDDFRGRESTLGDLIHLLADCESEVAELLCHPSVGSSPIDRPEMLGRDMELEILTSRGIQKWIEEQGVRLASFAGAFSRG